MSCTPDQGYLVLAEAELLSVYPLPFITSQLGDKGEHVTFMFKNAQFCHSYSGKAFPEVSTGCLQAGPDTEYLWGAEHILLPLKLQADSSLTSLEAGCFQIHVESHLKYLWLVGWFVFLQFGVYRIFFYRSIKQLEYLQQFAKVAS